DVYKRQGFDRAYAEISLDNFAYNYKNICNYAKNSTIMSIVKCNAYGHGAVTIANELQNLGSRYMAVATLEEAVELRQSGILVPLLILGPVAYDHADYVIENQITLSVFNIEYAKHFSNVAEKHGKKIPVHIKIDTGMSRYGFLIKNRISETADEILKISSMPGLFVEGVFSHMPCGDDDDNDMFNKTEISDFSKVIQLAENKGVHIRYHHLASSAAIISYPEARFNMVRPGCLQYGYHADRNRTDGLSVKPVMQLKTRVMQVKELPAGTGVSYNRTYIADHDIKAAVVGIGYGDGVMRAASNKAKMLVNGKPAKILGRICMDAIMIDITEIEGVQVGDTVTIFGENEGTFLSLYEYLDAANTICHEFLAGISPRVPRIYIKNQKEVLRQDTFSKITKINY
ncbi:MAG: alanine racemase, partial [Clostridiales bacterium]|nr:alanine racemase [Clostridiales bacterium]